MASAKLSFSSLQNFGFPFDNASKQQDSFTGFSSSKLYDTFAQHPSYIALLAVVVLMLRPIFLAAFSSTPLNKIPGPWYARYTSLHLRYLFARGTIWKFVETAHEKYGDVIRLGPRQVWVADKASMTDILAKTDLPKVYISHLAISALTKPR